MERQGDAGWKQFAARTNFLTNLALLNPEKKVILNPGIRVYFSNFNKSLSRAALSNAPGTRCCWPVAVGHSFKFFFRLRRVQRHLYRVQRLVIAKMYWLLE